MMSGPSKKTHGKDSSENDVKEKETPDPGLKKCLPLKLGNNYSPKSRGLIINNEE